ncbi:hypothetical protein ZWY2020_005941, partial [Hordeum vulgare]
PDEQRPPPRRHGRRHRRPLLQEGRLPQASARCRHLRLGRHVLLPQPKEALGVLSPHCVGNTVKLYNHHVCRLQKITRNTTTSEHYYYNSVPFSTGSLFPHMDPDRGELPITTGDGTIAVTSRFIKGVDKRATDGVIVPR